jgi:hypothetical protein
LANDSGGLPPLSKRLAPVRPTANHAKRLDYAFSSTAFEVAIRSSAINGVQS